MYDQNNIIFTAKPFTMEKSLMKYLRIFIIITLLIFSVSAAAEFYKYVDEDGSVRFTDDINQVPEAQRAKIRSYVESENQDSAEQEVTQENQSEQAATDQQTNLPDQSDDASESLEDAKKQIDALKSEIDQEYEALMKEKQQLAKAKEQEKGKDYKAMVNAYNQRITGENPENQSQ
jgi:flagellar motility protein MotE (MotC chaperone)